MDRSVGEVSGASITNLLEQQGVMLNDAESIASGLEELLAFTSGLPMENKVQPNQDYGSSVVGRILLNNARLQEAVTRTGMAYNRLRATLGTPERSAPTPLSVGVNRF